MRFLKAVIIGTIIGLLAYYMFRKRNSEERRSAPNPVAYRQRDDERWDAANIPADTVSSEQEGRETEVASPEQAAAQASSETLTLSNKPHTPFLFENDVQAQHPVSVTTEADLDDDDQETASDDSSQSVVILDGIEREVEPTQHPGRRAQTGEYYSSARDILPKASLRCRDDDGEWMLYLEMPEKREVVGIRHNDEKLVHCKEIEIQRFTGQVVVDYKDGGQDKLDLYESTPLYFRTDDAWERDGTLVRNHSKGFFIAIAPVDMDDEFGDCEEHEPEECVDPDFNAHFLAIDADTSFYHPGQYQMKLDGDVIYDLADSDEHGELYIGTPPNMSVSEMVAKARIVEETGNVQENRWGKNFDPHSQTIASVLNGLDGRFTVRTYLKGSRRRHESRSFRYFKHLRRIALDGEAYDHEMILTPDENNGYFDAQLKFEGSNGLIEPVSVDSPLVSISDDGLVTVPADPSIKSVVCEFANCAVIKVEIPRVWWRLIAGEEFGDWNDIRPISRADYRRIAGEDARIEILLPRSVNAILVGFGETQEYRTRKVQDSATIHLRDFVDDAAIEGIIPGSRVHLSVHVNEFALRLMEIGVPMPKRTSRAKTKPRVNQSARWVEVERGSPSEICRSSVGHWWKDYEIEPGHPIRPIIDEEGREIRNCQRCGVIEVREE